MKEKTIRLRRKKGPYRSDIRKFSIEGVEIDNYFEVKVHEKEKLVDTIIEKRKLPEKVKPPHVVPAPAEGAKLMLIDHKDPFWTFKEEEKRDKTYWVARNDKGETRLIDAVTGKEAGHGVPPPSDRGTAMSGYCAGYNDPWGGYRRNAAYYFNHWGYSAWSVYAPSKSSVGVAIKNKEYKYHYALAHGDYNRFQVTSRGWVHASNVRSWMTGRPKFNFAFLGQCGGMVRTGSGTMCSAFRKGKTTNTVVIGYHNAHLSAGWRDSLSWQKKLFETVNGGYSWYIAFQRANAAYPACREMVRFVGDKDISHHHIAEEDDEGGGGSGTGGGPRGRGGGTGGSGTGGRGSGGGSGGGGPRGRGGGTGGSGTGGRGSGGGSGGGGPRGR